MDFKIKSVVAKTKLRTVKKKALRQRCFENSIIERGARTFLPEALRSSSTSSGYGFPERSARSRRSSGGSHNAFVAYNHDFEDDPGQLMADNHPECYRVPSMSMISAVHVNKNFKIMTG